MSDTAASAPRAGAKQWWGLAVLVIPSTLLFMMLTILFLAAPNLAADMNPSSTQLLWILDIYGFVMAGFLVAMGVLGDRIGKRLLMVIGAILFAAVSVAASLTTVPELMIVPTARQRPVRPGRGRRTRHGSPRWPAAVIRRRSHGMSRRRCSRGIPLRGSCRWTTRAW